MASYLAKIVDFFTPEALKRKGLEESAEDFQQRIDLIVGDLIYPYLHPSEESKTGISTSENERFLQLLSLLEPDQCQKISLVLADNLDRKYNKVELEQFAKSIYIEHPTKLLSQVSKQTMCQSVAVHYTKILNLIAAILSAVNPEYNICLNRLNNLMTLTTSDATVGISHVCQRSNAVASSILDEPGMKQLLVLYYFALVQDISTPEEKENITKKYNYLVNSFSNLVYKSSGSANNLKGLMEMPSETRAMMETTNEMQNKLKELKNANTTMGANTRVNGRINKLEGELMTIQNQIRQQAATSNTVSRSVLNKLDSVVSKMERLQSNIDDMKMESKMEVELEPPAEDMTEAIKKAPPTVFPISPDMTSQQQEIGFQPEEESSSVEEILPEETELIGEEEGEMLPPGQDEEPIENMAVPSELSNQNVNLTNTNLNTLENNYVNTMPNTSTPMTPGQSMPNTATPMTPGQSMPNTSTPMTPGQSMPNTSTPMTPGQSMLNTATPMTPGQYMPNTSTPMTPEQSMPNTAIPMVPPPAQTGGANNTTPKNNASTTNTLSNENELAAIINNINKENGNNNNSNMSDQEINNVLKSMSSSEKPVNIANVPGMENSQITGMSDVPLAASKETEPVIPAQQVKPVVEKDVVSRFLEFAEMYSKIDKLDPKVMPFIQGAFRKQNNFDPAIGFQKDLFIPTDNFELFCKANTNASGEINIDLNDSKYKEFLADYENLKRLYMD